MEEILLDCTSFELLSKVEEHLHELNLNSSLSHVYWLPVPSSYLTEVQAEHQSTCGPYAMAVTVRGTTLNLETVVRAMNNLHCPCIALASKDLQLHMSDYLVNLIQEIS